MKRDSLGEKGGDIKAFKAVLRKSLVAEVQILVLSGSFLPV
jgi:hypothetical protein